MALNAAQDTVLAQRANLNIAAAVVARVGVGASDHLIGNVISDVRASHSIAELASAGDMSGLLGAVDTAIARNAETNRPFNVTDSRAAQLAGQGAGSGDFGWQGDGSGFSRYGLLQGGRGGRGAANDSSDGGGSGGGSSGGSRGTSGSAYAISGTGGEPAGAPFWGSPKGMMMTRAYANDNNMNWAPPDLMKMGRPALQALKDSGLKGDGYQALHKPSGLHLDNPTIVGQAGFMKRNGCNHNEHAKAADELHGLKGLSPEDRKRVQDFEKRLGKAKKDGSDDPGLKDDQGKIGDDIIAHDPKDPRRRAAVQKWQRTLNNARQQEHRAEHGAKAKVDTAQIRKRQEKAADAGAVDKGRIAATNNKAADAKGASALNALNS